MRRETVRTARGGDGLMHRVVRMTALSAALCITVLATQAPAIAAQTDPISILKQLPGLKAAYARKYISADQATPCCAAAPTSPGVQHLVVTATVLEFKSAFNLSLAERLFLNDTTIHEMLSEPNGTVTKNDVGSVGPHAEIYLVRTDIGDGQAHALLIAHHGTLAFLIRADGPEASLRPALVAFGTFMVNAKPGPESETENHRAGSTGGLWNLFPSSSDKDVLHGLVPMYDYDLLGPTGQSPIGSATPAS